jgi:hypothetical protein
MDVNQMYPSRFLKGAELRGPVTVTISAIRKEQTYKPGEGQTDIFVLYCERASRGVVLSKPLAFSIAQALGEPDTDQWTGRAVTLYPQPMRVAGRDLIAIRARAADPQPAGVNGNGAK